MSRDATKCVYFKDQYKIRSGVQINYDKYFVRFAQVECFTFVAPFVYTSVVA